MGQVVGYIVVNPDHSSGIVVCDEECLVYATREQAGTVAAALLEEHQNRAIMVMEVREVARR